MTDEKDMAKQLKYRAGDVVTLKVARLGEMGAFLDAGTGDTYSSFTPVSLCALSHRCFGRRAARRVYRYFRLLPCG